MFPVYYFDKMPEVLPDDKVCYIVSKYIYLKKKIGLVDSLVKVDSIDMGVEIPEYAHMSLPKMKAKKFGEVLGFFKMVYEHYRAEAGTILNLKTHPTNPHMKKLDFTVPLQKVSGGSCKYEIVIDPNYLNCGTIHSHAGFGAFHSGTDVNDEKYFDGLHITVGNVDRVHFSMSACVVINGKRVQVDPKQYIEGIELSVKDPILGFDYQTKTKYYHLIDETNLVSDEKYLKRVEPLYQPSATTHMDSKERQRQLEFEWGNWQRSGTRTSIFTDDRPTPCQECIFKEIRLDALYDELDYDDDDGTFNEKDKQRMENSPFLNDYGEVDRVISRLSSDDEPLYKEGEEDENAIVRVNNRLTQLQFSRYERAALKRNIKCDCGTTFFVPNPREKSVCPNCEKEHEGKSFTMEDAMKMHRENVFNSESL
jgi:hypothetical protein